MSGFYLRSMIEDVSRLILIVLFVAAFSLSMMGEGLLAILCINLLIVIAFLSFPPKSLFSPLIVILGFNFLYVVLPSVVQIIFDMFDIKRQIPWDVVGDWLNFQSQTYVDILLNFSLFFFLLLYFNRRDAGYHEISVRVKKSSLHLLSAITIFFLILYVQLSGGVVQWILDYKTTFLTGREGTGWLNLPTLFLVNATVFLLGLEFNNRKGRGRMLFLFFCLFVIILAALVQGLKSRLIILLVIFFFPSLSKVKVTISRLFLLTGVFFLLLFAGNYIRSGGYYSNFSIFVEYFMSYFNAYGLHDLVTSQKPMGLFMTIDHMFAKPLSWIGLGAKDADFDISVMLTKEYFPASWFEMSATQQWPLATEMYFNYYGYIFGWLPILVYCCLLSLLYKQSRDGHPAFALIYILEFFRLFTVQRGVLVPWQMPIYLVAYLFLYVIVRWGVRRVK